MDERGWGMVGPTAPGCGRRWALMDCVLWGDEPRGSGLHPGHLGPAAELMRRAWPQHTLRWGVPLSTCRLLSRGKRVTFLSLQAAE